MRLEIDATELTSFVALLERAPEVALQEFKAAAASASLFLQRKVQEDTPRGVGQGGGLSGSILAAEPVVLGDQVIGAVGTSMSYAVPVELGTKPHFPPVQPLRDWVRYKLGITDEEEIDSAAMAIARKIAARGTKGAHMFENNFREHQADVAQIFVAAAERVTAYLGAQ